MSLPGCIERGEGDLAVWLLHGIGGGKEIWLETMGAIAAAGVRAIACDLPGYGASPQITPYTMQGLARALEGLLDATGARRNVLVGHSMGGMIAQELIAYAPAKVHALVLCATSAAFGQPDGPWQQRFLQGRLAALDAGLGMAGVAARLVPAMLAPDARPQALDAALSVMSGVPEATYRAALAAITRFDRRAQLARIAVPALCIAGERDTSAPPAVMQRMAERIKHGEFVCIAEAGHLLNLEQPAAFAQALTSFLRRFVTAR